MVIATPLVVANGSLNWVQVLLLLFPWLKEIIVNTGAQAMRLTFLV